MNAIFPEVGISQLIKHGEELCGDNVQVVNAGDHKIIVISDGLGSGVKANILAILTTKIIAGMLKYGSCLTNVVETVINTLPVCKVRNIAYSTFQIIDISNTGETSVVEFDCPPTYLYRNGRVLRFPTTETTIAGKILNIGKLTLIEDDIIVGVSDGVIHAGIGGLLKLGWTWTGLAEYLASNLDPHKKCQCMSADITNCCEGYYLGSPGDDATAVAIKMRKPINVALMVGPPTQKKDDTFVVNRLMVEEGMKIVSGGTTANVVARLLGEEVIVEMPKKNSKVPPLAKIAGVDLVTEGILTINATLDKITNQAKIPLNPLMHEADDILAKALLEADNIKIFAGRAVNVAHNNNVLPLFNNFKEQLIVRFVDALQKNGKDVIIEWY